MPFQVKVEEKKSLGVSDAEESLAWGDCGLMDSRFQGV